MTAVGIGVPVSVSVAAAADGGLLPAAAACVLPGRGVPLRELNIEGCPLLCNRKSMQCLVVRLMGSPKSWNERLPRVFYMYVLTSGPVYGWVVTLAATFILGRSVQIEVNV